MKANLRLFEMYGRQTGIPDSGLRGGNRNMTLWSYPIGRLSTHQAAPLFVNIKLLYLFLSLLLFFFFMGRTFVSS